MALDLQKHKDQIEAYSKERPDYVIYADVLRRVLEAACKTAFPEVLVQARAKSIASFAEKVARKFDKYPDAVHQMTDLCGARVSAHDDHRLAMSLAVAGLIARGETIIEGWECVADSFPNFSEVLSQVADADVIRS